MIYGAIWQMGFRHGIPEICWEWFIVEINMVKNISTTTTIVIHSGMVNMVNTDVGISITGAFRWEKRRNTWPRKSIPWGEPNDWMVMENPIKSNGWFGGYPHLRQTSIQRNDSWWIYDIDMLFCCLNTCMCYSVSNYLFIGVFKLALSWNGKYLNLWHFY